MPKVRGMGGVWVISTQYLALGGRLNQVVHNSEYTVTTGAEIKRSKTPSGKGWTEALPVWRFVEQAFFRVPESDDSYPTVLGFTEGAEITVYLARGERGFANGEWDRITNTIVEKVHIDNDQKKARWAEITCRAGRYERLVVPPAL